MSGLSSGTSKKGEEAFLKISALHGQFDERYALGRGGAVGVGDHSRYAILVACGDEIAEADAEPVSQVGRRESAAGEQCLQAGEVGGVFAAEDKLIAAHGEQLRGRALEDPAAMIDDDQPVTDLLDLSELM